MFKRGRIITRAAGRIEGTADPVLALVYAPGQRPDSAALAQLAADAVAVPFTLSHVPPAGEGWVELLAGGLTFDCRGLAPAAPAAAPGNGALLGLRTTPAGETVTLEPAPHLAAGRGLLPVVRMLAGIGAELARRPEVAGVYWHPARCWMAPKYFCGVVQDWLGGGAFPALGLTSLQRQADGAMVSLGLDYLIGQDLRFEPDRRLVPAAVARIAVRLIHELVAGGALREAVDWTGPDGEALRVQPMAGGRQLRIALQR